MDIYKSRPMYMYLHLSGAVVQNTTNDAVQIYAPVSQRAISRRFYETMTVALANWAKRQLHQKIHARNAHTHTHTKINNNLYVKTLLASQTHTKIHKYQ